MTGFQWNIACEAEMLAQQLDFAALRTVLRLLDAFYYCSQSCVNMKFPQNERTASGFANEMGLKH